MHGRTSKRKGHVYKYYNCSKRCGAPSVHMEEVDDSAIKYLRDLLDDQTQQEISDALRLYQAGAGSRMVEFKQALKKRIAERQRQYDALMANLSSGALPPEVVADIGQQMQALKVEIATLEQTEPPKDFTADTIKAWLESIKAAPDEDAIHLLIERIDVGAEKNKAAFNMKSTLKAVLRKTGCGGGI